MDENIKQNPPPKPASPSQSGSSSYTRNNKSTPNFFEKFLSIFSKKTTTTFVVLALVIGVGATTIAVQNSTEFRQQAAGSNTISGTVFIDTNENGSRDSGEVDYPGTAIIKVGSGIVATKYGNGYYFNGLASGPYTVALTVPSGYRATTSTSVPVNVPLLNSTFSFGIKSTTTNPPPVLTATPATISRPNLITTSASKNGVFYEGQSVSFSATVKNTGAASAGSFDTQFRICQGDNNCADTDSPRALGTPSTGSLGVNATNNLSSGTWGNISRGKYTLRVWADIYSQVNEGGGYSELDNGKWLPVCVEGKPNNPTNPSPASNPSNPIATGVSTNPTLSWTFGNYNNTCASALGYRVDYGTNPYSLPAGTSYNGGVGGTTGTRNLTNLSSNTTYYWRVVECNGLSCTFGPIWGFKTTGGTGTPPATSTPTPAPGTCSIEGTVYIDTDGDGIKDGGELGYNGATLTRTGSISTTTISGLYNFAGLNGTYIITLNEPPGYTKTTPTSVSKTVCPSASNINFGIKPSATTPATTPISGQASITTDRTEYQVGSPIQYCYRVPGPGQIKITDILPDGNVQILHQYADDGTGHCFTATISLPLGRECLKLDYTTNPGGSGTKEACFQVVSATSPGVTGNPTLPPAITSAPTPTIPAGNTSLALAIGLDAIGNTGDNGNRNDSSGSNKEPRRPTRNIIVELFNSSNNEPVGTAKTGNVIYANGLFTGTIDLGTEFAPQSYNIKVKSDGYLKKKILGVALTAGANTAPPISLVVGDINGDNQLTILDYNILISCSTFSTDNHGACNANAQYAILSDFEDNGVVNIFDYNLFLREYSVQAGD